MELLEGETLKNRIHNEPMELEQLLNLGTQSRRRSRCRPCQGNHPPRHVAAQLELGRVYQKQGDTAKARIAYQNFLADWKDADPDVPLLHEAKAEYAKLQ